MTRKDHEAFAVALKELRRQSPLIHVSIRDVARMLAVVFSTDNPRFNRARFLKACGEDN